MSLLRHSLPSYLLYFFFSSSYSSPIPSSFVYASILLHPFLSRFYLYSSSVYLRRLTSSRSFPIAFTSLSIFTSIYLSLPSLPCRCEDFFILHTFFIPFTPSLDFLAAVSCLFSFLLAISFFLAPIYIHLFLLFTPLSPFSSQTSLPSTVLHFFFI